MLSSRPHTLMVPFSTSVPFLSICNQFNYYGVDVLIVETQEIAEDFNLRPSLDWCLSSNYAESAVKPVIQSQQSFQCQIFLSAELYQLNYG
jgi:hypothetical protein